VPHVFAHVMAGNTGSRRVLEKCGLVLVPGAGPGSAPSPGGSGPAQVEYALTRAQWAQAERAQAERDRLGAADLTQAEQA
jgi:hypothetical protein